MISVTTPAGDKTEYSYDENGNLLSQTDANGHITSYTYNKLGRKTSEIYPDGSQEKYFYDKNSNMTQKILCDGSKINYNYDNMNREVIREYSKSGNSVHTSYNADGSRRSVTDKNGVTQYIYNMGRLSSIINPDGTYINYSYDNNGNVLKRETPFGNLDYNYGVDNRLTKVSSGDLWVTYSYNSNNSLANKSYSNGMQNNITTDVMGRVTEMSYINSSALVLADYKYTRDGIGNILNIEESQSVDSSNMQATNYSYNANNMLTDESSNSVNNSYDYDGVGNRVKVNTNSISFNNRDQLANYSYDRNGRLISDGTTTYNWGDNDRLISVTKDSKTTYYKYNADGYRVAKFSSSDTSYYLIDPTLPYGQVIAEYGKDTTFYVYGLQREILVSNSDTSYYVYDITKSTRNLVDNNENITDSYKYSAFGEPIEIDGTSNNHYMFTGEEFDFETGLQYNRARWYSAKDGLFISMDPQEGDGNNPFSFHRYMYAENNPLVKFDPSGETTISELYVGFAISSVLASIVVPKFSFRKNLNGTNKFTLKFHFGGNSQISVSRIPIFGGMMFATISSRDPNYKEQTTYSIVNIGIGVGLSLTMCTIGDIEFDSQQKKLTSDFYGIGRTTAVEIGYGIGGISWADITLPDNHRFPVKVKPDLSGVVGEAKFGVSAYSVMNVWRISEVRRW